MGGKKFLKGAWLCHVNHLNFAGHQPYFWNGTADRLRRCQLSLLVSLMVVGQLLITPTVEICIQKLGRVE